MAVVAVVGVVTVVAVVAGARGGTHHGRHLQTGRSHICISQLCRYSAVYLSVRDSPPTHPSARWRGGGGGVLNASHFAVA